jgi:phosphomannomutase
MSLKPEKVFKRYDIRGEYPEELDEEFAERLGKALGTFTARNYLEKVIVCRDGKDSSRPLKDALIEGLKSSGIEVIDIGVGPTDYAAWCGKREKYVSVQVTSSHMPLNFNGFKFMYPEGNGFVNEDLYEVQDIFRDQEFNSGGGGVTENSLIDKYRENILNFASKFDEDSKKKIVFESMGGEARILPELLEEHGHEVIDISEEKRPYMDPPDPKPENLEDLGQKVKQEDADLGISNDLDADRITVCYRGRFLSGDEIFSILAQLMDGEIVASIDTSKALENFGEIEYTRVGDPFVMDKALEIDAKLAGEPNGHYSFTEFVPYNSGILSALILSGLDLEERLEKVPDESVAEDSVGLNSGEEVKKVMQEFESYCRDNFEVLSDVDGVKFVTDSYTVLVRPSGSSPKIRVKGFGQDEGVEDAVGRIKDVLNEVKT